MFIIGHLRGERTKKIFPIRGNSPAADIDVVGTTKREEQSIGQRELVYGTDGSMGTLTATDYKQPKRIIVKGELDINAHSQNKRVYDTGGISPSLTTMQGGGQEPKIIIQPVLTPDRVEKRQNGRRFKEPGEPMFTLTSQDRHGIAIKEATKQGYKEAYPGDSVNLSVPNSKTRRGRVGKQIANTLDTGCQQGVVTEDIRIRKLTPKECWRLQGFPDELFEKAAEVNSDSQLYKQAGNSVTVNVIYEIAKRLATD